MAPKSKASKTGATVNGSGSGSGSIPPSSQDPMLQGTYLHNDADDFESPSHELDEFDERLTNGMPAHSPQAGGKTSVAAGSGAKAVALQKQMKAGDKKAKRPPMRSSFDGGVAPSAAAAAGNAPQTSVTEEEADEQTQRQQDIDDVRNLDARFGGAQDSDDSD